MAFSPVFSWFGWYFIPHYATKHTLQIVHRLSFSLLRISPPPPGTPNYHQHYRITYTFIVLGYLLYQLIDGAVSMQPNFYEILGVPPDVDDNGLKVAFRQFAKRNHPDRPGVGPAGAELFIMVRDVFEALKNPVVRFAYDRFGPDVLTWGNKATPREYLEFGLMRSSGYHGVMGLMLLIYSSMGRPSSAKFWRYILYFTLLFLELSLLLYPSPSPSSSLNQSPQSNFFSYLVSADSHTSIMQVLFPRRVAYQHILFLHQLFVFLSSALSNVLPFLFPDTASVTETDVVLDKFNALAGLADREASMLLHTELHSIQSSSPTSTSHVRQSQLTPCIDPHPDTMRSLSSEMETVMIERNLMQAVGPLRTVWESAIGKRRRWERVLSREQPPNGVAAPGVNGGDSGLPSPVSPVGLSSPSKQGDAVLKQDRLPSPRPSPPPPPSGLSRRGSSFAVRARSVSLG